MKIALLLGVLMLACAAAQAAVTAVKTPPAEGDPRFYVFNRAPLVANPLAKLPLGTIRARGWLDEQLRLMAGGMVGNLHEVSPWLGSNSGWLDPSKEGWEELPYWLKGYTDLAILLEDREMRAEAMRWVNAILKSQEPDGYFGPRKNKENHDLWPNMVVLYTLQTLFEDSRDSRIVPFMRAYFRYQNEMPIEHLIPESWQKIRAGDNLESIYWLYNRTGDEWLLDLGKKLHERTADWTGGIASHHGVNFCQAFRQPASYYQQSRDEKHLMATEARYAEMIGEYGQVPGGMFGADENCRTGKTGPEQAAETCSMAEFMNSFQNLLRITGDPKWADRCEEVAFNSLPASMTPDLKGLHYLTAPNQVLLHKGGEHCFQNQGRMVSYSALRTYRCCQHNIAQSWPYFTENLWMATRDNGVAAVLYAPSEAKVKVGNGALARITEETGYPFSDTISLRISLSSEAEFPLYLRVPGWCKSPSVQVNGDRHKTGAGPSSYIVIHRNWRDGDLVSLRLAMDTEIVRWEKQGGAASVKRGPLWYSLRIGEEWEPYVEDSKYSAWPDFEVRPTTPWNYALIPDADSIRVKRTGSTDGQPFTLENAPVVLSAKARRAPQWELVRNSPASPPASPMETGEPIEEIEMIPMGAARLRITVFPTASE